jgi:hypothetical protein
MYGIGQLHSYGLALMARSLSGLVAAALCHAALYGFHFLVERPFVARAYAPVAALAPGARSARLETR